MRPSRGGYGAANCSGSNASSQICREAVYTRLVGNFSQDARASLLRNYVAGNIEIVLSGVGAAVWQSDQMVTQAVAALQARSNSSVLPANDEAFAYQDQRDGCLSSGGPECCLPALRPFQVAPGEVRTASVLLAEPGDDYENVPLGLSTIAAALEKIDESGMSKSSLVSALADSGVETTYSPSDQLTAFLWNASLAATGQMIELARKHWPQEPRPPVVDVRPAVLRGRVPSDAPPSGLNDRQHQMILSAVNRFVLKNPESPIRSYLENLNGLVAVEIADPKEEFDLASAAAAREQVVESVRKSVLELQALNQHNFEVASEVELKSMRDAVKSVEDRLREVEAYANSEGWMDIAKLVGQAVKAAVGVYKNLFDQNWEETGRNVATLIKSVRDIEDAARKMDSPEALRALLLAALEQQRALQERIAGTRRVHVEKQLSTKEEIRESLVRYNGYTSQAKLLADEMFRNVMIRYAGDNAGEPLTRLKNRLGELNRLVTVYPTYVPNFSSVDAMQRSCNSAPKSLCDSDWGTALMDCVMLPVSSTPYTLMTASTHPRLPSVPLFRAEGDIESERAFQRILRRSQVVVPPEICDSVIKPASLRELQPDFSLSEPGAYSFGSGAIISVGYDVFIGYRPSSGDHRTNIYKWSRDRLEKYQELPNWGAQAAGSYVIMPTSDGIAAYARLEEKWRVLGVTRERDVAVAGDRSRVITSQRQSGGNRYFSLTVPDLGTRTDQPIAALYSLCGNFEKIILEGLSGGCPFLDGTGAVTLDLQSGEPHLLKLEDGYSDDSFGVIYHQTENEIIAAAPGRWTLSDSGVAAPSPVIQRFKRVDGEWRPAGRVAVPSEALPNAVSVEGTFLITFLRAASSRYLLVAWPRLPGVLYVKLNDEFVPYGLIASPIGHAHADANGVYIERENRVDVYRVPEQRQP